MKDILFLGDSLTAGTIGTSYLKILEKEDCLKNFNLINAGENGFTMAGLLLKLETYLKENNLPDILVLEGGANDLLLPHMQNAGNDWDPFIRKLSRHGSKPAASLIEYETLCRSLLQRSFDSGISQVFICTIPCLGENLNSDLNRAKENYNRIFRDLCKEYDHKDFGCICIDAALTMEESLIKSNSNWLFKTPADLQNDAHTIMEKGEEFLCEERNLLLTIDGAHLNQKGAEIFSSLILDKFREFSTLL